MNGQQGGWDDQFFSGLVVEFWKRITPRELTLAEADFLERVLGVRSGAALLDLPCGYGRHALELAARGLNVTGVEISDELLELARSAPLPPEGRCEFLKGDMRWPTGSTQFDGIYSIASGFGYLHKDAIVDYLGRLARSLRPKARAVFDNSAVAEVALPHFRRRMEMTADDMTMVAVNHYDAAASRMDSDLVFRRGPRIESRTTTQYVYSCGELRSMMQSAGLEFVAAYGSISEEPFGLGSERLLLVVERRT